MLSPTNVEVSEHSRKFYDGTYKLMANGFTNELGIYRAFDCYDPDARAPTPLPPVFPDDEDQYGGLFQPAVNTSRLKGLTDSHVGNTELPDELFLGHPDRERLRGKFEGILLASKKTGTPAALLDCYRICGMPYPEEPRSPDKDQLSNQELTPPQSTDKVHAPANDNTEPKEPNESHAPYEDTPSKPRTRGVAQKVRKVLKSRAAAAASRAPAPAVLAMQTTLEDASGRRRSARQARTSK
ncbi:hypothetical protein CC86DRAFT_405623 [Ophiobolus disseminans]|uniref:Uncharacterized protein n=1 Tax=Ophiobolus disseminans TaxID=1469910 RepID=A0A6A7A420_9PLEO|nr:hypothetical protein CC86DRAFT_405623 [Ophiobolus disseminans]